MDDDAPAEEIVTEVDAACRPVRIAIHGALTTYHANAFHAACLDALDANAAIDLDLRDARYLGAAAIQIVLALGHSLRGRGHALRVLAMPPAVAALLAPLGVCALLASTMEIAS
jgi:anti-anti-sigma regulatory factor